MNTFDWPVRVYYEDTDAGGVVYYANYLRFLERARTEWLRALGFDQERLIRERAILFAVRRVEIDYLLPARLDDGLVVEAAIGALSRVSLTFEQCIRRGPGELLAQARVQVVCLDSRRFRPSAIPADILEKLQDAHQ